MCIGGLSSLLLFCLSKEVDTVLGCVALRSTFPFQKHFLISLKVLSWASRREKRNLMKFKDNFFYLNVLIFHFNHFLYLVVQQRINPTTACEQLIHANLFILAFLGFLRKIQKILWLTAVSWDCQRTPVTHSTHALWTWLNSWQIPKSRWMLQT